MPTALTSPKRTVQITVGIPYGGAEGSRTPVRKRFDKTFSGRSQVSAFPLRTDT